MGLILGGKDKGELANWGAGIWIWKNWNLEVGNGNLELVIRALPDQQNRSSFYGFVTENIAEADVVHIGAGGLWFAFECAIPAFTIGCCFKYLLSICIVNHETE
jgi:hypothetical protein